MKWFYTLLALAAIMVFGCIMSQVGNVERLAMLVVGMAAGVLALNVKCPRCKLHISGHETGTYLPGDPPAASPCPRCGRTRQGVWPFQYLVAPEPWDGSKIKKS